MAVGPVGQSVTTGPVGPCGIIPQHEADYPIADLVERVHRGLKGTKGVDSDRFHNYGENLDNPGMGCDEYRK